MDLLRQSKLLVGIKTKTITPSIYSLLLESEDKKKKFLHTCVAFTLEEASEDATAALRAQDPKDEDGFCMTAKVVRSIESLLSDLEGIRISSKERTNTSSVKNLLMKEIIENKDTELLEKYKKMLNKKEKAYICDRLAGK